MPDIAIPIVLGDRVYNTFNGVNLVRAHYENLFLGFHQDHITTDKPAKGCLLQHQVAELE